jgi:hypothetical protein
LHRIAEVALLEFKTLELSLDHCSHPTAKTILNVRAFKISKRSASPLPANLKTKISPRNKDFKRRKSPTKYSSPTDDEKLIDDDFFSGYAQSKDIRELSGER